MNCDAPQENYSHIRKHNQDTLRQYHHKHQAGCFLVLGIQQLSFDFCQQPNVELKFNI